MKYRSRDVDIVKYFLVSMLSVLRILKILRTSHNVRIDSSRG